MPTIAIHLILIEYVPLFVSVILFGIVLYFFLEKRKELKEVMREYKKQTLYFEPFDEKHDILKRNSFKGFEDPFAGMAFDFHSKQKKNEPSKKLKQKEEIAVQDLKRTIAQQQKMLDSYLRKTEELEHEGRRELNDKTEALEKKLDELRGVIEEKNEEIKDLRQQASAGQKMAARLEEVYQELEQLQTKMAGLEKQASRANNLAIELEDTRYSYEQVHKELLRKQEKLDETMDEKQKLHQQMNELEDKLSEANLQRQQLQKKVQFLTDLNNDIQSIADTNKKLQAELRRIGELESMLNMMAEERDYLLRKKMDK